MIFQSIPQDAVNICVTYILHSSRQLTNFRSRWSIKMVKLFAKIIDLINLPKNAARNTQNQLKFIVDDDWCWSNNGRKYEAILANTNMGCCTSTSLGCLARNSDCGCFMADLVTTSSWNPGNICTYYTYNLTWVESLTPNWLWIPILVLFQLFILIAASMWLGLHKCGQPGQWYHHDHLEIRS